MSQYDAEQVQLDKPQKKKGSPNFLWIVLGLGAVALLAWHHLFSHC